MSYWSRFLTRVPLVFFKPKNIQVACNLPCVTYLPTVTSPSYTASRFYAKKTSPADILTDFQKTKLTSLFKRYLDLDGNGKIQWNDFDRSLRNFRDLNHWDYDNPIYQRILRNKQIAWRAIQKRMDENYDGEITIDEFFEGIAKAISEHDDIWNSPAWLMEWIRYGFDVADRDNDGIMTLEDYIIYVEQLHELTFDAREHFKKLDEDDDGVISREQWECLWNDFFFSQDPKKRGNLVTGPLEGAFVMQYV